MEKQIKSDAIVAAEYVRQLNDSVNPTRPFTESDVMGIIDLSNQGKLEEANAQLQALAESRNEYSPEETARRNDILRRDKAQQVIGTLNKEFPNGFLDKIPLEEADILPIFDAPPDQQEMLIEGLISQKNAMSTGQMVATGGALAAEMGIGMGAQAVTGGNPIAGSAGAFAGNSLAQGIRMAAGLQDNFNRGELAGATAAGLIPAGSFAKGQSAARAFIKDLALNEAGYAVSETIRSVLDEGRIPTSDILNIPSQALIFAGAGASGLGIKYGEQAEKIDRLRKAGIDTVNMPQSVLTDAPWAAKVDAVRAATDLKYRERVAKSFDGLGGDSRDWIVANPDDMTSADLAAVIRPYLDRMDDLQIELDAATKKADSLTEQSAKAAADATISGDQKTTIYAAASESVLSKAIAQMQMLQYAVTNVNAATNAGDLAKFWSRGVSSLIKKQMALSNATYKEVGLKSTDLLLNADELADTVQQGLSRFGKLKAVDDIVSFVRASAQVDEVVDAKGKITKVAKEGNNLDNGQLLEIRRELNKKLNPDSSRPNVPDSLINEAYDIIRKQRLIGARDAGIDVKKLSEADAAYAKFMTLRDDKFASRLLDTEISDETVSSIAKQASSGNLQDMQNALAYAREVGPEAEGAFAAVMQQTLKETLINEAYFKAKSNNKSFNQNLADSVLRTNAYLRQSEGLKNFNLGFGDDQAVRRWNYAFNQLDIKALGKDDLNKLFADPLFRNALSSGDATVASSRAARKLYEKQIFNEQISIEAGVVKTLEEKRKYANRLDELSRQANFQRGDVAKLYDAAKSDPFTIYLSGKGRFGVTSKVGEGASKFAETLIASGPTEAKLFMDALGKSNPAARDLVLRELRTKTFGAIVEDLTAENFYSLDFSRVSAAFNNPDPNSSIKVLKALSTDAEWAALSRTTKVADILTKHRERGKLANTDSVFADIFGVLVGGTALLQGGFSAGTLARNLAQRSIDTMQRIGFGAWAQVLGDRKIANNLAKVISGVNTFQQLYNPVQLYNMQKNTPEIYALFNSLNPDAEEIAYLKQKRADAIHGQIGSLSFGTSAKAQKSPQ